MDTLNTLALIAHVLIAASIIGLVLVQKGKGADAGAGFGAGASGTVFGARGSANFLSRSTAVAATLFFVSSLGLAFLNSSREPATSLLDDLATSPESAEITEVFLPNPDESLELPPLPDADLADESLISDDALPEVPELPEAAQ